MNRPLLFAFFAFIYLFTLSPTYSQTWQPVGPDDFTQPSFGQADWTSIAIYQSSPYVVFRDYLQNYKATVRRYNTTTNTWEGVGTAGFSAGQADYTTIAVDGSGTPYVAYRDAVSGGKATVKKYNGTNWVDVGTAGFSASSADYICMAIDASGTPYVLYRDNSVGSKATVKKYNSATDSWDNVGAVGFSTGQAAYNSIAIDASGTPYVVYTDGALGGKAIVKKYNSSTSTWDDIGQLGSSIAYSSIAITTSGKLYVAYREGSSVKATVKTYNGTVWSDVGAPNFSAGQADYTSIAVDASGNPYIIYKDNSISNKAAIKKFNGTSWVDIGGNSVGPAEYTVITTDASGNPYIIYSEGAKGNKAIVKQYNGTSWIDIGVSSISPGFASNISTSVNNSGSYYLVYGDYVNSVKATVKQFNGTNWVDVGAANFSTGAAYYTSITHDAAGVPYIIYSDGAAGNGSKATVKKYNGSSWVDVGAPLFSLGQADWTKIAMDASGTPYVAYQDWGNSGRNTVKKFNGTSWVDVGAPGISAGQAYYTSLAISATTPYISFRDGVNANKVTVKKYNGTAWVDVGTAGFSASTANYISIAIDAVGTPYVVYQDGGNSNKVTVKKFNGTAWVDVGTAGFSIGQAEYTSIVIDAGIPYVSYRDIGANSKIVVKKFNGATWEDVGTGTVSAALADYTALSVSNGKLILTYNSTGAYAKQYAITYAPRINVAENVKDLSSGALRAFPAGASSPSTLTYTISNYGNQVLNLTGSPRVKVTGANAADFTVTQPTLASLNPGQSTTFTVTYNPGSAGIKTAQLTIDNNDPLGAFVLNLKGAELYGPQYPFGPLLTSTSGSPGDQGRAGGKTTFISAVANAAKTTTYWGPQVNTSGELQLKVSLDNATYTDQEILTYTASESDLANGKAVWRGETFIPNAITGVTNNKVYIRATLTTKNADNTVAPMIDPVSVGLSEQTGGLIKVVDENFYFKANYLIEASTNPTSGFQPYLVFYDAYPTPPGPLPGGGVGNAYSTINNAFYWVNFMPSLVNNNVFNINEGEEKVITTSSLSITDYEDMPSKPEALMFEFKTTTTNNNPLAFNTGVLKLNGTQLTNGDTFTLKDIQDGKLSFVHDGSETIYDEFQFSFRDSKGVLGLDGGYSVYSFKINVVPVNDAPVSANAIFNTSYAAALNGTLTATDAENDPLTFALVSGPSSGSLVLNADGTFTYTPTSGAAGTVTFTYKVFDGTSYGNTSTVTINLLNMAPNSTPPTLNTFEDVAKSGTLTATDPENESFTFQLVSQATKGTVNLNNDGSFTYQPAANKFGDDSFIYKVVDAANNSSANLTVAIQIRPRLDEGDILVADKTSIRLIDASTSQSFVISAGSNLTEAQNLIYKNNSSIFVLDKNAGIVKVNPFTGAQSVLITKAAGNFNSNPGPLGITFDKDGNLVIADGPNGIVKVDTTSGALQSLFVGGSIQFPTSVLYHENGDLLIADAGMFIGGSSKIIRVTPAGTQSIVSAGFAVPVDLTAFDANTILVSDGGSMAGQSDKIIKVDLTNGTQTVISSGGSFSFPSGIDYHPYQNKFYAVSNSGAKLLVEVNLTNGLQSTVSYGDPLSQPFGLMVIKNKKPQTITFAALTDKTYGDADFDLTATSNSGLTVNYTSSNTAIATVVNGKVHIVGAGEIDITATQIGDNDYDAAVPVIQHLKVNPKAITITADAKTKTYGDADPSLTYAITAGSLVGSDSFTGSLTRVSGENVGPYAINQGSLVLSSNYDLTFVSSNLTIGKKALTVTADAKSKTYGDADPSLTYAITAGSLVGSDSFTGSLTRVSGENVGPYAINQGSLVLNSNYDLTFVSGNLTIGKKALTVTADAKTKIYGDADPSLTYAITAGALVGSDSFTGSLTRVSGENVGPYAINQGSLVLNSNYDLTFVSGNLTIGKKALTITAVDYSRTYGAANPAFTVTYNGFVLGDDESKLITPATATSLANATSAVGTYAINANGATSADYSISYVAGTLTVTPAALTIKADDKSKIQNTPNPALTATFTGFMNGENSSVLTVQPVLNTTATIGSGAGMYPISVNGASATNYAITYVNGTLTVIPGTPTSITLALSTLFENQAAGTSAGTLSSTSDDPNASFTYSLVTGSGDTDNALFSINGNQISTTATLNYEQKSSYSIRVRSTTQYGQSLDKIFVVAVADVNEAPTLNAIANQQVCAGAQQTVAIQGISAGPETTQTTTLSVSSTNAALFASLSIKPTSNGNADVKYTAAEGQSGTATVTVVVKDNGGTANGGTDTYSRSFTVTVNALPQLSISSDKGTTVSKGQTVQLTAAGGLNYQWSDNYGFIDAKGSILSVRPSVTTTYRVVATNESGCSSVSEITISVAEDFKMVDANNILTPNGDGVNDVFLIKNIDMYPNNELSIYDRAGRLLFTKKGYNNDWDGTFNGMPLSEDTYYYILTFTNSQEKFKGFVSILRK